MTGVACCDHGADCGAAGDVEMPDWDVSLVTEHELPVPGQDTIQRGHQPVGDVAGDGLEWHVRRRLQLPPGHRGWTLASGADTAEMFAGADTWLSLVSRADGSDTTDGPPAAWVASELCLMNEHVQSGWCVACGAGKYNGPGDDPSLGVDTRCDAFADRTALKTAVDNCLAVDPTGVACCSSRRGLRRRGDGRDAGLGRVAGDGHKQSFLRRGLRQSRTMCLQFQRRHLELGCQQRAQHGLDVSTRSKFQSGLVEMGCQLCDEHVGHVQLCPRDEREPSRVGYLQSREHEFLVLCYWR